jgi:hypothetical protein
MLLMFVGSAPEKRNFFESDSFALEHNDLFANSAILSATTVTIFAFAYPQETGFISNHNGAGDGSRENCPIPISSSITVKKCIARMLRAMLGGQKAGHLLKKHFRSLLCFHSL